VNLFITIELSSLSQVEAIGAALELHIDMESSRRSDAKNPKLKEVDRWTEADEARLKGAIEALAAIRG
jgi:hypothetical protein